MTVHDLKQYRDLCKEVQDLNRRISKGQLVSDVVTGSSINYPYTQHPINICGMVTDDELSKQYTKQRDRIKGKCLEIERWVESIDDSYIRSIVRHYFIDGLTWRQVAQRIGGNNTEDGVKQAFRRYLNRN